MVGADEKIFTFYPSRSSENAFPALKKKAKFFQDSSLLGFGRNNIKLNNFQKIKCYASSFTSHPSPSVFLPSKCLFFSTIHAWQPYLKSDQFNFTVAESICLPKTCSKSEKNSRITFSHNIQFIIYQDFEQVLVWHLNLFYINN